MKGVLKGAGVLVGVQALLVGGYFLVERTKGEPEAPLPAESNVRPEQMERAAPELKYRRLDGSTGRLRTHRGRRVLVHFWATWCPPCRKEMPTLVKLAENEELDVLLLALDPDWGAVRRFFDDAVPASVVLADAQAVEERFGTHLLPESFLVDAGGTMRWRLRGARDWKDEALILREGRGDD